jgi:hypothetical protein
MSLSHLPFITNNTRYMEKPIAPSLIYRKQSTTTQVPVAFADASSEDKSVISTSVQKIFNLILLDN